MLPLTLNISSLSFPRINDYASNFGTIFILSGDLLRIWLLIRCCCDQCFRWSRIYFLIAFYSSWCSSYYDVYFRRDHKEKQSIDCTILSFEPSRRQFSGCVDDKPCSCHLNDHSLTSRFFLLNIFLLPQWNSKQEAWVLQKLKIKKEQAFCFKLENFHSINSRSKKYCSNFLRLRSLRPAIVLYSFESV